MRAVLSEVGSIQVVGPNGPQDFQHPVGVPTGTSWILAFWLPSQPGWALFVVDVDADLPEGPGSVHANLGDPLASTWYTEQLPVQVTNRVAGELGVSNQTMAGATRAECAKAYCNKFDFAATYGWPADGKVATLFDATTVDRLGR